MRREVLAAMLTPRVRVVLATIAVLVVLVLPMVALALGWL